MRGCQASRLRAVLALSSLVLLAVSAQAKPRIAVYITSRACETDSLLSAEHCRNAFANAEAEFNDRAPIFSDQEVCERQFSRCVISFAEPPNPKALRYSPAMSGVQVTVNADLDRTVVPILDGSHPTVSFSRRTVMSRQDGRSRARQPDAEPQRTMPATLPNGSTWALRGTVDPSVQVLPPSQLSRSEPRFAFWCSQFCAVSSGPNPRALGLNKPGTALFVPMIDPGARPYETMETHRFSRAGLPVPRSQPRFMR
jgi:uncharacterized protein YgiB involved in biofilm formation